MSHQLLQGIHRQGLDVMVEADEARPDARGVELRTYACLTPEFLGLTRISVLSKTIGPNLMPQNPASFLPCNS